MVPTIKPGSLVLVERLTYIFRQPRISDLVIFKINQERIYIKRISAKNKDKYFMAGDNKSESQTSKHFGWVDKKDIIGKVFYIAKSTI